MKIKLLKAYNLIIAGLMALLGFTNSCDSQDEYGTPSAEFIVNGKVLSAETNLAIENIRVSMEGDTAFTNAEGEYLVSVPGFPEEQVYSLKFQDIDGTANLEFFDIDTIADFRNPEYTGGDGHWYKGETSLEFDIKMTPKK